VPGAAWLVAAAIGAWGQAGCTGHGEKLTFGKGEIYYKKPVTENEAKRVGAYLLEAGFFNEKKPKSVQLLKDGDVYELRFVVANPKGLANDVQEQFKLLAGMVSHYALGGSKVEVHFCDRRLRSKKSISVDKDLGDFGKRLTFERGEVFYKPPVTAEQAKKLGSFLLEKKFFSKDRRKSVQLTQEGSGYHVRFVLTEKPEAKVVSLFNAIGKHISTGVLPSKPVKVSLCDELMECSESLGPFQSGKGTPASDEGGVPGGGLGTKSPGRAGDEGDETGKPGEAREAGKTGDSE
jgi:hypothetical protein